MKPRTQPIAMPQSSSIHHYPLTGDVKDATAGNHESKCIFIGDTIGQQVTSVISMLISQPWVREQAAFRYVDHDGNPQPLANINYLAQKKMHIYKKITAPNKKSAEILRFAACLLNLAKDSLTEIWALDPHPVQASQVSQDPFGIFLEGDTLYVVNPPKERVPRLFQQLVMQSMDLLVKHRFPLQPLTLSSSRETRARLYADWIKRIEQEQPGQQIYNEALKNVENVSIYYFNYVNHAGASLGYRYLDMQPLFECFTHKYRTSNPDPSLLMTMLGIDSSNHFRQHRFTCENLGSRPFVLVAANRPDLLHTIQQQLIDELHINLNNLELLTTKALTTFFATQPTLPNLSSVCPIIGQYAVGLPDDMNEFPVAPESQNAEHPEAPRDPAPQVGNPENDEAQEQRKWVCFRKDTNCLLM